MTLLTRGWNRFVAALRPVFRAIKALLHMLDGFLLILSPLIIILFVILVIVLLDNYGTNWKYLQKMQAEGEVVWGVMVDTYDPAAEDETYLGVIYPTYYDPDEIGLLRIAHYSSEQLLTLHEGAAVEIRHLPNDLEETVMLQRFFDPLGNLWQMNRINVAILLVSWLIIAWHPEMLYLGYGEKIDPFTQFSTRGK